MTSQKTPPASPTETKGRFDDIRRLLGLLAPYRRRFLLATVFLIVGSAISLIYPQVVRRAVDLGADGLVREHLTTVLAAMVGLILFHGAVTWVRHYLMSWLGERVVADLRATVFQRLVHLPPSWFQERRTGEVTGRLAADVATIEGVVGSDLSIALRNALQFVGGVTLLFVENVRLTLIMLAIVPPIVLFVGFFGRRIRKMSKSVQDKLAETSGLVDETLQSIETVQAFAQEDREAGRYEKSVDATFDETLRLTVWRASFFSVTTVLGFLGMLGVVTAGLLAVFDGSLSAGDLTAFLLYTSIVASSFGSLTSVWGTIQRALGATERLQEILDEVPTIRDAPDAKALPDGGGALTLQNVDYHYPSRPDAKVLSDVNIRVAPGEVVALVGPSGSGKSTIARLLLRFGDPSAGHIAVEGEDVRGLTLSSLRGSMAVVSQEPVLFSGTIAENIAYGDPNKDRDAVVAAATAAHADQFIRSLPSGYETLVGERGVKLSGGQRQRVAIARALLKDPRILILDEATSSLDSESESLVQAALTRLMEGRTTLVIAHRLSTVRGADRIIVLDNGVVSEEGNHDALIAKGGLYARLVEHQLKDDAHTKHAA